MDSFLHRFLAKFLTTAGVRIALAASKWLVLVHAALNLPKTQFAQLAAVLSAAEILRVVGDLGTESIVYARARSRYSQMPYFVRACFHLRTATSLLLFLAAVIGYTLIFSDDACLPLLSLIVVLSLQSTALVLLQRSFSRTKLMILVANAALALVFVAIALHRANLVDGASHARLIVIPELWVTVCALALVRKDIARVACRFHLVRQGLRTASGMLMKSAAGATIVISYSRLDVLLVMPLLGAEAQASYSAGLRLIEPLGLLFVYASTALLSELGVRNLRSVRAYLHEQLARLNGFRIAAFVLVQLALALSALIVATRLLHLETPVGIVAALFAFLLPVRALSAILSAFLYRFGRIDRVLAATVINLGITLLMSLTLGAQFGIYYICLAAILGEVSSTLFLGNRLARNLKPAAV